MDANRFAAKIKALISKLGVPTVITKADGEELKTVGAFVEKRMEVEPGAMLDVSASITLYIPGTTKNAPEVNDVATMNRGSYRITAVKEIWAKTTLIAFALEIQ